MPTSADPNATITLADSAGVCAFRRVSDDVVRAVVGEEAWEAMHAGSVTPRGTMTITAIDRAANTLTFTTDGKA